MSGTAARKQAATAPAGRNGSAPRQTGTRQSGTSTGKKQSGGATERRALDPDVLAALEAERDFLLRSLRDLETEHDAGDLDEHDYLELKDGYTSRAGAVLRAIEERQAGLADAAASRKKAGSTGRKVGIVALVVGFAILAGILMAAAAGRRGAGDSATGDIRQTCREGILQAQGLLQPAPVEALKAYDEVLDQCPGNAEALTYKGWLFHLTALQSEPGPEADRLRTLALQNLLDATVADPGFTDAWIFLGSVYKYLGRPDDALAALDRVDPARVPPFMAGQVEGLRAGITGSTPGTTKGTTPITR